MDNNSEVISSIHDSTSGAIKCHDGNIFTEKVLLFQLLQKAISEARKEHIAYTNNNTNLLTQLNLQIKMLPNDIKETLERVATILKTEKLFEFDEIALRIARERKIIEEKKRQREERQILLKYDKLFGNCAKLQRNLEYLQDTHDLVEKSFDTIKKQKNELDSSKMFLSTRLKEYRQAEEKLETEVNIMMIDEIIPEEILRKYKLYFEKSDELAQLDQSISEYNDLPPNLLQAKQLLENKRKQYKNLEQQFLENS